jgi:hypothetical protein
VVRPTPLLSLLILLTACTDTTPKSTDTGPTNNDGTDGGVGTDGTDGSDGTDGEDGGDGTDGSDGTDGTDTPTEGCRAEPRPADADRMVIVSFRYNDDYDHVDSWGVFRLTADGTLTTTGERLEVDGATTSRPVFTPDGSLALIAGDDGDLGVVAFEDDTATVVEAHWNPGFWASAVAMDPSGERAWVINQNWEDSDGGLYELALDCETGLPSLVGKVASTRLALNLLPLPGRLDRAALVAVHGPEGDTGDEVMLLDIPTMDQLAGAPVFSHDDAFFADAATTPDGGLVLVNDVSSWSGEPQGVGAVRIDGDTVTTAGFTEVYDPASLVVSPWGDAALVSSAFGDEVVVFGVDAASTDPLGPATRVSGAGVPTWMVGIDRGLLAGRVLLVEAEGIRQLQFDGAGGAESVDYYALPEGIRNVPYTLGVQP